MFVFLSVLLFLFFFIFASLTFFHGLYSKKTCLHLVRLNYLHCPLWIRFDLLSLTHLTTIAIQQRVTWSCYHLHCWSKCQSIRKLNPTTLSQFHCPPLANCCTISKWVVCNIAHVGMNEKIQVVFLQVLLLLFFCLWDWMNFSDLFLQWQ